MALDLIVRGAGSNRSPGEHLAAVLPEYDECRLVLFGNADPESGGIWADEVIRDSGSLLELIRSAADLQLVVYGDESLLPVVQDLEPGIIWITLGSDANGVREIWRIRQQHSWLSNRRLGLLIEQTPGAPPPDTDRLMRLSRAVKAVLVEEGKVAPSRRGIRSAEPEPVIAAAPAEVPLAEAETAATADATAVHEVPETTPAAEPLTETEPVLMAEPVPQAEPVLQTEPVPEVEPAPEAEAAPEAEPMLQTEPLATAEPMADAEPMPAPEPEPMAAFEPVAAEEPAPAVPAPPQISEFKGADVGMPDVKQVERSGEQAEQALMQRYALVKERRTTSARIAQVEANMNNLLKEIFVSRFAVGPEAAAAFENLVRKLSDASAEFTQLSRAMANIEQQLTKLAWVKDELEI